MPSGEFPLRYRSLLPAALILCFLSPLPTPEALCQPSVVCGEWEEVAELKGRAVRALLVSGETVLAATDKGVYRMRGESAWQLTALSLPTLSLASRAGIILAGTEDGVYVSADGGSTWSRLGLEGKRVEALAASDGVIYAGTHEGVYRFEVGRGWRPTALKGSIASLAADPVNPRLVYAGTRGTILGELGDLYISADGGATWSRVWLSNITRVALIALLPLLGFPVSYSVESLAVNPCNPGELYAGTSLVFTVFALIPRAACALHVSRDYGGSWGYTGPPLKCVFSIGFSSESCGTLALGTHDGVYYSKDGGVSWLHLGPANISVNAVAVSSGGGAVYAGTDAGLLAFRWVSLPTSVNLAVATSWIAYTDATEPRIEIAGNLTSAGAGLPAKTVVVHLSGVEVGRCRTNAFGGFNCSVPWRGTNARTVNLTVLYPGEHCYEPSGASQLFHFVNVTTAYGSARGAGWYKEGGTATVEVASTVVSASLLTEMHFRGWKVKGVVASSDPTYSFTVREPVELEAVWEPRVSVVASTTLATAAAAVTAALVILLRERRSRALGLQ